MRKTFILVLSCIIGVILLILTGAFVSNVISDKHFAERETYIAQTTNLAEAGVNHGTEALRNKILVELNDEVSTRNSNSSFLAYVDDNTDVDDSLDFLCDFVGFSYPNGITNRVEYAFDSNDLPETARIKDLGSYSGKIIIKKQKDSDGNDLEAYTTDPSNPNTFVFPYEFTIETSGAISSISKNLGLLHGQFDTTVQRINFARFALFTNQHRSPGGDTVWFTGHTRFGGPVHTNDRFSFANNPSGYFTDVITQNLSNARFYNNGYSKLLDADRNGNTDVPTFEKGFQRSANLLNLESEVTQNDLCNQALGDMTEPGSSGIYIPNNGSQTTGGIYIKGDSTINMSIDGSDRAVYSISQGSGLNKITKKVSLNYQTQETQIQEYDQENNLVGNDIYSGLPEGQDDEGVIIFSRGNIKSLRGTVQKNSQVTISSEDDIRITGHIRYQQYDTTPDTNAEDYTNLLGILSWEGNVRIGSIAPSNLDIHGVIMAPNGVFTVDNYAWRSPSGNVTLLGGVITDKYGPFGTFSGTTQVSGYGRNFIYDRRMLGAMSPPYFPTATDFMVTAPMLDRAMKDMDMIWQKKD
jgi:hypothetical protein